MFEPHFQQMVGPVKAAFGGGQDGGGAVGMDSTGFLMDMPLLDILHFQENALPMPPEYMVDSLLAQVSQSN